MFKKLFFIFFFLIVFSWISSGQVRVRIFANQKPSSALLTVTAGRYEVDVYDGKTVSLTTGDPVILAMYDNKIAVKIRNSVSFMCDSLTVKGLTGNDRFSFRINGGSQVRQFYSGDLQCISDLGVIVFINICDVEQYIAGVVRTEGGPGKSIEYLKSQAVLARTFMYKYFEKHLIDRYNLCDNTHCQAFNGISTDTLILRAALETKGLVVLDRDSTLIISAFHSNCGGETSTSDFVWLSGHSYIKKVIDPYCTKSPNATWRKSIPLTEWEAYLKKSGFVPGGTAVPSYNFSQLTRQNNYRIGSFSLPFGQIRNDLNLRSSFFSVVKEGNLITFKGRGYGHGVGLCQEGAMVMAARGFKFSEIIGFYYSDVIISDIKNAKIVKNDL
jgi:stage II sporulation protein D (peptidoglycan lytic transglycosylase)